MLTALRVSYGDWTEEVGIRQNTHRGTYQLVRLEGLEGFKAVCQAASGGGDGSVAAAAGHGAAAGPEVALRPQPLPPHALHLPQPHLAPGFQPLWGRRCG